jgi:hypothetical protein
VYSPLIVQGVAVLCAIATSPLRVESAAIVTGAIDFPKYRTSANSAPAGSCAGYWLAIVPANAGSEAAQQHAGILAIRDDAESARTEDRWRKR